MEVYKFGGASVRDANGIRNVSEILKKTGNYQDKVVVVSAMGKMTNALEEVVEAYLFEKERIEEKINFVRQYHKNVVYELFQDKKQEAWSRVESIFEDMNSFMTLNRSVQHSFVYDQIVGLGEIISSTIVSMYLKKIGVENNLIDVRGIIKTDDFYRDANVDWSQTQRLISEKVRKGILNITQGFLGSDENNFTTTLGREGSDYSAAILAYCLNSTSVTIWKDVVGVLNADPRYFENTQLLREIPYEEAIELAFYGASVIHPKTLQPLKKKNIPLYVRSFIEPEKQGTAVCNAENISPKVPCFILKQNQNLISVSSKDFSFIEEENLSYIFSLLSKHKMKVSIIQNSAISFSFCVDNKYDNLTKLIDDLSVRFNASCIQDVNLYTIRQSTQDAVDKTEKGKTILLKQVLNNTVQIVTKK